MPSVADFTEEDVRTHIVRAVTDVFATMLDRPAVLLPEDAPPPPVRYPPERQIVGTVGFAGNANGVIYLRLSELFARRCTGSMLGLDEVEMAAMDRESVSDAVGELSNIVAGSFKTGLYDAGYSCKLSIPATVSGVDFTISPKPGDGTFRRSYRFDVLGQCLVAEVILNLAA
jgi:chemotaxis protein CheX